MPLVLMVVAATGAPFVWTRASLAAGFGANLPYASPSGATFGGPGGFNTPDPALIAYLKANRHGERFFVATSSAMSAESIVIETGEAVMALGGFSGSDPVLTETALRSKISTGEVRFFMLGGFGPFGGGGGASSFVSTECTTVAAFSQLSDCANLLDKSPKQP